MSAFAVVLGVAQDGGHPQAACTRPCCARARQRPEQRHLPACLGLVHPASGGRWLVDATPALPEQLERLRAAAGAGPTLSGILITHAHMGHYTGLIHLGNEAAALRGLPVWCMPRMDTFLRTQAPWELLVRLGNVELRPLSDGQPVALAPGLEVTPFLVPHRDEYSETVGFRVRGRASTVAWLPDVDSWDAGLDLAALVASVDVAFIDATFWSGSELPWRDTHLIGHPTVEDTLRRLAPLGPELRRRVRLVHLNHTNPLLDPQAPEHARVRHLDVEVAREGEHLHL